MVRKRGLGRGLDALLGGMGDSTARDNATPDPAAAAGDDGFRRLPVDLIRRGKHQPRRIVEESALEELAHSVRARGIVQPIVVRPTRERRLRDRGRRAALAGGADGGTARRCRSSCASARTQEAAAVALIENIQREDLNPIEEAEGYRTLAGRVRADPPGARRHRGAFALLGVQHAAPAGAQPRTCGPAGRAGRARHGARAGPARALRRRAERDRGGSGPAGAVGARDREAGAFARVEGGDGRRRSASRATPTWSGSRPSWPSASARRCASTTGRRAAGSLTIHYNSLEALDGILRADPLEIGAAGHGRLRRGLVVSFRRGVHYPHPWPARGGARSVARFRGHRRDHRKGDEDENVERFRDCQLQARRRRLAGRPVRGRGAKERREPRRPRSDLP